MIVTSVWEECQEGKGQKESFKNSEYRRKKYTQGNST